MWLWSGSNYDQTTWLANIQHVIKAQQFNDCEAEEGTVLSYIGLVCDGILDFTHIS